MSPSLKFWVTHLGLFPLVWHPKYTSVLVVWERERETERKRDKVSLSVCIYIYVCVCVCVCMCVCVCVAPWLRRSFTLCPMYKLRINRRSLQLTPIFLSISSSLVQSTRSKAFCHKDSFYEEIEQLFNQPPMYHMKILLDNFNAKVGRENMQMKLYKSINVSLDWPLTINLAFRKYLKTNRKTTTRYVNYS